MAMPKGLARYWRGRRRTGAAKRSRRSFKVARFARRTKMTIPLAVVGGFVPILGNTFSHFKTNGLVGPDSASSEFIRTLTGFDPWGGQAAQPRVGFQPWQMQFGALPIVIGFLAHKAANMIGINRMLARLKIPLIRL